MNNHSYHKQLFSLAIPMILSNITVPLLGLVDTAVIGHLPHAYYLGASAVGAMIIVFITWLCSFLRMSTTGLTAQAYGSKNSVGNLYVLVRGILLALVLGVVMILFQTPYFDFSLWLAGGSTEVQLYARQYIEIRVWGLPAALSNLVLLGWLLGNQRTKAVMWLLITTNCINLLLDLWFVLGLNLAIEGVAYATVIAEYSGMLLGLWLIFKTQHNTQHKTTNQNENNWFLLLKTHVLTRHSTLFSSSAMKQYFSLNRDILIRTLCLEFCFVFITFQGTRLGDEVVAANAILLNFLLLISLGLDGIANATEAMIGEANGAKSKERQAIVVKVSLIWTFIFAVIYSLIFIVFSHELIGLITTIPAVIEFTQTYIVWLWFMPLMACWCYLYDGIYIGLMQAKIMRNSMMASTFLGFFPLWYLLQGLGNHAIWAAFSIFMVLRGATLAWHYHRRIVGNEAVVR